MDQTQPNQETSLLTFDFRPILRKSRLAGVWFMMKGFRLAYLIATLSLAVSSFARVMTYFLLR